MCQEYRNDIVEHFADLDDPRWSTNREHKFIDILVITICAAICGADDWVPWSSLAVPNRRGPQFSGTAQRDSIA